MRGIIFLITVAALASSWTGASSARESCQRLGNQVHCSNGQLYEQFGNTTYDRNGRAWEQLGNQSRGSDGRCSRSSR